MKTRSASAIILVLLFGLASAGDAGAKNRNSLLGKVKQAFSGGSNRQDDHQSRAARQTPEQFSAASRQPTAAGPTMPRTAPPGTNAALFEIRRRAESIAHEGLRYKFGGDTPREGGMDCSGTMMYLLKGMGVNDVPRTSYAQYEWVKDRGNIRRKGWGSDEKAYRNLKPGDLIFWGNTYNSGHKVSHVMIYLGQAKDGRHFMFGARGKKSQGVNGSGVDIFEMKPGNSKLVGYGSVPGLRI